MKQIQARDVKIINYLLVEIAELEQEEYIDRRSISPKERKIDRILKTITEDKEEQKAIYRAINKETFNTNDYTFKPIVDNLKKIGYEIVYTKKENKK
jgi:hypothetical protein